MGRIYISIVLGVSYSNDQPEHRLSRLDILQIGFIALDTIFLKHVTHWYLVTIWRIAKKSATLRIVPSELQ